MVRTQRGLERATRIPGKFIKLQKKADCTIHTRKSMDGRLVVIVINRQPRERTIEEEERSVRPRMERTVLQTFPVKVNLDELPTWQPKATKRYVGE